MNYHISTAPIFSEFTPDCECPMCKLEKITVENVLFQFLNDAVMEDDTRAKVNKLGFCADHFDMLFGRQNKLSVALQAITRMRTLNKEIQPVKDVKSAKKQAEKLSKLTSTCIVCSIVDDHMRRYAETVAQLYANDKDFVKQFKEVKGFCMKHYVLLLERSNLAGFKAKEYLATLTNLQHANLERLEGELQWFCDKHDYRNREKPLGSSADALPRTRTKFYGEKKVFEKKN